MLTVGVLQADDVVTEFQAEHGNYPDMFDAMFARTGRQLATRHYPVHKQIYPDRVDECDAYIITGSAKSVYDDEAWIRRLEAFVVSLHEREKTLVGICFGHQLVGRALGGRTELAAAGWGVGVHSARVCGARRFLPEQLDSFRLIVSHRDQVTRLPPEAEVIAESDFCPISGMQVGEHLLSFQGHPEFDTGYSAALLNMRRKMIGEEVFRAGLASLHQPLDRELVADWIVDFMQGATQKTEFSRRRAAEAQYRSEVS